MNQGLNSAHFHPLGDDAMYVVYPVQTLVCAGVLAWFWPRYRLRMPEGAGLAIAAGVLVLICWVAPGAIFLQAARPGGGGIGGGPVRWAVSFFQLPRTAGFNPDLFGGSPIVYWTEIVFRLARTAIVVPLLEEIFWRGFLLRYFIRDEFTAVPFGTYARNANLIVAVAFMLEHSSPDWPAALVAGFGYNIVAFRTRSLSSCVLAHAITNALLAAYILHTRQWGFW